jgi:hypothetical protein
MVKIVSGGGIRSNKTVQSKSGWKSEPRSRAVSVESTAQLGASTAFREPDLYSGRGYKQSAMPRTGVPGATVRPDTPGPGSGRTTYAKGTQAHYGPNPPNAVNKAPDVPGAKPGRDILSDYGYEITRRR